MSYVIFREQRWCWDCYDKGRAGTTIMALRNEAFDRLEQATMRLGSWPIPPAPSTPPDAIASKIASRTEVIGAMVDSYNGGSWDDFLPRLEKRGFVVVRK